MRIVADRNGIVTGKFTIPSGVPSGNKQMVFIGGQGSYGEAIFAGQGTLERKELREVTTVNEVRWWSPPPPPPADPVFIPPVVSDPVPVVPDPEQPIPEQPIVQVPILVASDYPTWAEGVTPDRNYLMFTRADADSSGFTGYVSFDTSRLNSDAATRAELLDMVTSALGIVGESAALAAVEAAIDKLRSGTLCTSDPLAQTFSIDAPMQVTGVDLWFTAVGSTPIEVSIRETSNGLPTQKVRGSKVISPSDAVTSGNPTRILFDNPVFLRGGEEYALVILCDDDVSALSLAELGKYDSNQQRWVTSQPYQVGVMLSSSNAVTWTPHQDRDLTFRLLTANYTATERVVSLGKVVVTDATDLLLMSYAERPSSDARVDYRLTLPDGSSFTVTDGQQVRLPSPVSGNVLVSAVLRGGAMSPVLHPGTQVASGRVAETANYITRAVPAGQNVRVKVVYEAIVPSGSTVNVDYRGIDTDDNWLPVPQVETMNVDNGWVEFTHEVTGVSEDMVHVQLRLTGTSLARPRVKNLRVVAL